MDNQNNNSMFSNMIQPNVVPEVKDNNSSNPSNQVSGNGFSNMIQPGVVPEVKDNNSSNPSNQVSGNGFSNMIQPSAIPEVNDTVNSGQVNNFSESVQNNSLNQVNNDALGFGIPQTNDSSVNNGNSNSLGVDSMFSISQSTPINDNSFVNSGVASTPVNSTNSNLDMGFSMPGEATSNPSINSMEQSSVQTQPNNNAMGFDVGGVGSTSDTLNTGLNTNDLGINNPTGETNNSTSVTAQTSNVVSESNGAEEVVSVKKYLIHMLLCCIPIVGFIILIMRALDRKDKNISNLARAQLLISAIAVLLGVVLMFAMGSAIAGMFVNI